MQHDWVPSYTRPAAEDRRAAADHRAVTPFRFPLERLRALRERSEDLAKQELAGALARRSGCAERLQALGEDVAGALDAKRASATGPARPHELVAHQAWLERVEQARQAGEHDLGRHDADVEAHRGVLVEASRERQALERLKARRSADHARAMARAEGAVLDEIALAQHRRSTA
jgi:flagellar protein FliJ